MTNAKQLDLGFTFQGSKSGHNHISRKKKLVTILRGPKARDFVEKIRDLNFGQQQQLMARVTGNYKRGNE